METCNKTRIIKYFFMWVSISGAIYFWAIISALVKTKNSESWLVPMGIFSIVFIFWALAIILENNKRTLLFFAVALVAPGVFFTQNIFFILSAFLAVILLHMGTVWIHRFMDARVKLNIWASLRFGRKLFVSAFTLVIIGGFLIPVLLTGEKRVLPVVNVNEKYIRLIGRGVATVNPEFNFDELVNMTTDEYILKEVAQFRKNDSSEYRKYITPEEEQIALLSGRNDISRLTGRKVQGEERIMDIFIEIINHKINNYFNTEFEQSSSFAPLFFAGISLFAVFSVGSFVTMLLTILVAGTFRILVLTNLIKIDTKSVEMEVIK